jgi:hypothetical protein
MMRSTRVPGAPQTPCLGLLADVLQQQYEILADENRWTRGALAKTLLRESVVPLSDRALSWSLNGALARAMLDVLGPRTAQSDWQRLYDAALDALWRSLPDDHACTGRKTLDLDGFNDFVGTHHEDVLDVIHRALASLG